MLRYDILNPPNKRKRIEFSDILFNLHNQQESFYVDIPYRELSKSFFFENSMIKVPLAKKGKNYRKIQVYLQGENISDKDIKHGIELIIDDDKNGVYIDFTSKKTDKNYIKYKTILGNFLIRNLDKVKPLYYD